MTEILGPIGPVDLASILEARGYPWKRVDEVIEQVASEHGITDEHGQYTRDFTANLIVEVVARLGPAPKKTGRKLIGPEIKTRMAVGDIAELDRRAQARGVTRADLIRWYLRERLEAPDATGQCIGCGRPGPADEFCDACMEAGATTEIPQD